MATDFRFKDEWLVRLVTALPNVTPERVQHWRDKQRPFLSQALIDEEVMTFEELAALVNRNFKIRPIEVELKHIAEHVLALVPEKIVRRHHVLPVDATPRTIDLAMANPLDEAAVQDVEGVTGRDVNPLFCSPATIQEITASELGPDAIVYNLLRKLEDVMPIEVVERESNDASTEVSDVTRPPIVQLVDGIISNAVHMRASDIHIEHDENTTTVRFRIDGVLKNIMILPRYVGAGPLVSRIKITAGMDVTDRLRPQDGRAKLRVGEDLIGLRVSTLPSRTGEKVVMRILNERSVQVRLEDVGFHPNVLRRLVGLLNREQGILLVTGPTGSGKTTTLYAGLNSLKSEAINIVTVEDPVEYRLPGITQVQVNDKQGLTFATVLRSVLRQDPDVVLVGEIRDGETAAIAMQASLTGHIVLSTLHTNDCIGAVARLVDMGVEHFKVASAVSGVTAQRLVRRVCTACAEARPAEELDPAVRDAQITLFGAAAHVKGRGCVQCGFSGYLGRLPLVELLEITPSLREAIGLGATAEVLHKEAIRSGALHTLQLDALWHVFEGRTTVEQIAPYLELGALELTPEPIEAVEAKPLTAASEALVAVLDPVWRIVLEQALKESDYDVTVVSGGVEALARVAKKKPQVLIAATNLPDLDGIRLIDGIRRVIGATDLPIFAFGESAADLNKALEAGADDVLQPPIDVVTVAARVRNVLQRRTGWSDPTEVMKPPIPANEVERLEALRKTALLDTAPEEKFDRFTRKAQELFNVPMSKITLVDSDRQWFKSQQGMPLNETSRDISFCGHGINNDDLFIVPDATLDARFSLNPLVTEDPNVRFYAGYPIAAPGGEKIGMFCILDHKPRELTDEEKEKLRELGRQVTEEVFADA